MPNTITLPRAYFVALVVEGVIHGIYTVLFIGALYLLLGRRRRQTARASMTNLLMVFATIAMYSLSTTHFGLAFRQNLIAFFDQRAIDGGFTIMNDPGNPLVYTQIAVEIVNCLIGDTIVCWRTWVIWGRYNRILIVPAICILGSMAAGIGLVRAFATTPPGQQVFTDNITRWFAVYGGMTCLVNLYAIAAISFKAWRATRALRRVNVNVTIHGGKYHGVLLIVLESGMLYILALFITIILFAVDNNGVYIITDLVGHLTGIYPTAIIVLVCLNMSFHDDVTRAEKMASTMQFEQGRAELSTSVGMSRPTVLLNLMKENQRVATVDAKDGDMKPGDVAFTGDGPYELAEFSSEVWRDAQSSGATTSGPKSTLSSKGDTLV